MKGHGPPDFQSFEQNLAFEYITLQDPGRSNEVVLTTRRQ